MGRKGKERDGEEMGRWKAETKKGKRRRVKIGEGKERGMEREGKGKVCERKEWEREIKRGKDREGKGNREKGNMGKVWGKKRGEGKERGKDGVVEA